MTTPIRKVPGEGNCVAATDRGEEACEWRSVSWQPAIALVVRATWSFDSSDMRDNSRCEKVICHTES